MSIANKIIKVEELEDVVCVLNPDDIFYLQNYQSHTKKDLVSPYDLQCWRENGIQVPKVSEGSILIKHPFANSYVVLDDSKEEDIVLDRINKIEAILSYLGGTEFEVIHTCSKKYHIKKDTDFNAGIDVKPNKSSEKSANFNAGLDVNVCKEGENDFKTTHTNHTQWTGGYTPKGYREAMAIAVENKLDKDPVIKSILTQRNPEHPNPIALKEYSVDVKSDIINSKKTAIKLAADIKTKMLSINPSLGFSRNVDENSSEQTTHDFRVKFNPIERHVLFSGNGKNKKNLLPWIICAVLSAIIITGVIIYFINN